MLAAQGGRQLAIGLIAGTALAFGLTRGFKAAINFASDHDGFVLAAVISSLCVTTVAAIALPVLRASRTDPVKALRQ